MKVELSNIQSVLKKHSNLNLDGLLINNIITELKYIESRQKMYDIADHIILRVYKDVPMIKDINLNPLLDEYFNLFNNEVSFDEYLLNNQNSLRQDVLGLVSFHVAKNVLTQFVDADEIEVKYTKGDYTKGLVNTLVYHEFYMDLLESLNKKDSWLSITSDERAEFMRVVVAVVSILYCDKEYDRVSTWFEISENIAVTIARQLPFGWSETEIVK